MEVTSKNASQLDHTFILIFVFTVTQVTSLPKIKFKIRTRVFVEITTGDIRRTTDGVKEGSGHARWDSKLALCVSLD